MKVTIYQHLFWGWANVWKIRQEEVQATYELESVMDSPHGFIIEEQAPRKAADAIKYYSEQLRYVLRLFECMAIYFYDFFF